MHILCLGGFLHALRGRLVGRVPAVPGTFRTLGAGWGPERVPGTFRMGGKERSRHLSFLYMSMNMKTALLPYLLVLKPNWVPAEAVGLNTFV